MFQIFGFLKFFRVIFGGENVFFKKKTNSKKISSELDFLGYSFDVKICDLSIYDVFRLIRTILRGFKSSLLFYNRPGMVCSLGAQLV